MTNYTSVSAQYNETGIRRFDGNPFIEALPVLESSKNEIIDRLRNYPPAATEIDRRKSELVRAAEIGCINEIVYPFAEYKRAGMNLTMNIRESYVARNPCSVQDIQRRHAIATAGSANLPFPTNWASTAKGQTLLGITGSGKTTFANAFSLPYQIVIEHTEYKGRPLVCRQIPWVSVRMSHDATLKSLCLQIFEEIDKILGNTNFKRTASAVRSISQMGLLIAQVATASSIGVILVDEVQNLKAATGKNSVFVLNLFSDIIEKAGVCLVVAGTPLLASVIDENVRNLRKLNSGGQSNFAEMKLHDPEFDAFCDTYWNYQFVSKPVPQLTPSIRAAWHRAGGGNPAFTAMAFLLAQRNEIGGREVVDEAAFDRVSKIDMAILEPAIAALRSGKASLLANFDDLLFKEGCKALRKLIAWSDGDDASRSKDHEFDEIAQRIDKAVDKARTARQPKTSKKVEQTTDWTDLPMENPLIR